MKKRTRITLTSLTLIAVILACNLPGNNVEEPLLSVDDQAATAIEATLMEGRRNGADVPITATFSPIPVSTATKGPTPTITPTYSTPSLTIREQTNCREGPSTDYEVLFTYLPNKKLEIIGRYEPNNFWLVKSTDSPTGSCWLWGEYVELAGSYWVVPTLTPPPTVTPAPPAAPSVQKWDFFCNAVTGEMDVTIKWTDNATNETGYRVIRDNIIILELPSNSTTFSETILLGSGESAVYIIEAINVTGFGRSTPINLTC
jgi:hypothetical protein